MTLKKKPKLGRLLASAVCAVIAMLVPLLYGVIGILGLLAEPAAAPVLLLFLLIPAAVITGLILALIQRYKELKGGEEDASADY